MIDVGQEEKKEERHHLVTYSVSALPQHCNKTMRRNRRPNARHKTVKRSPSHGHGLFLRRSHVQSLEDVAPGTTHEHVISLRTIILFLTILLILLIQTHE